MSELRDMLRVAQENFERGEAARKQQMAADILSATWHIPEIFGAPVEDCLCAGCIDPASVLSPTVGTMLGVTWIEDTEKPRDVFPRAAMAQPLSWKPIA